MKISRFVVMVLIGAQLSAKTDTQYVDFDVSMKLPKDYSFKRRLKWTKPNDIRRMVNFYRELYTKNCVLMSTPQKDPIIPKIIHQIWIGPNKPPEIFKHSQESIKRLHPDWEYKLWTDEDLASFNLQNQKQFDESKNYGERADILRYEILYRHGGTYLDVDVICVKPLDILHHSYEFYAGVQPIDVVGWLGNTIIGSAPGHHIMKTCIDTLKDTWALYTDRVKNPHFRVLYRSGPNHFERSLLASTKENSKRCIVFPSSYFYPLNYRDTGKVTLETISTILKPESFAVHFWAKTWHKSKGAVKE